MGFVNDWLLKITVTSDCDCELDDWFLVHKLPLIFLMKCNFKNDISLGLCINLAQ